MSDVRQMKATVEAAVKNADPKAISQTFYDNASDRLFVTLVKGSRKYFVTLRGRDFSNGGAEKFKSAIEAGVKRLQTTPIG